MNAFSAVEAERLAGSVLAVGFSGEAAPPSLQARLRAGACAGVVLFRRNVRSAAQVRDLCASLGEGLDPSPILAIDQEGGRVARLREGVLQLPAMRALGDLDDPPLTRHLGQTLGEDLAALGINLNFAPVCDVDSNPANPVIGDRAFGRTVSSVSTQAVAFLQGLQAAGVAACAKHFPGHGDTETDSHLELPVVRHDRARLQDVELAPFRHALSAEVATVMTAHVRYEALDPEMPATLSHRVLRALLRDELAAGRDDLVVVSDDLRMKAVSARWPLDEAAVLAINAGCDLLLACDDDEAAHLTCVGALARAAMASPGTRANLARAAGRVEALRRRWPSRPLDAGALGEHVQRAARRDVERVLGGVAAPRGGHDPTAR
ncbi:MAG: beta-N-acetylhexosaminidase [Polyangiales bacterium]